MLPPWVEYKYGEAKSIQVPFDTYFKVEPLRKYHKVILMEEFMKNIAPIEWPIEQRTAFCYMSRGNNTCNAKEGNPFGPFWDHFNIDFTGSEFYGPLHYDTYHSDMTKQWNKKYPATNWPVLAFAGAPASFPVQLENRNLHKYLEWSDNIAEKAEGFIKEKLPKGAFVGIHLRNGIDWVRACEHIPQSPNLFAAPQCLGYRNEKGKATKEMCFPTKETIIRQLKRVIKNYNNKNKDGIKSVYVSSDSNHMLRELNEALKRMNVKAIMNEERNPHIDLAILARSNHFVGNCISSYSAFVKRERDSYGFPSSFWAFPKEKYSGNDLPHDEL